MKKINRKIIVIVGPTASGKTGIGVRLAKELNGEIISADSRQVYRGLDLGTGKDLAEYNGTKYHLIDICEPGVRITLFDYLPLARKAIEDIFSRGKVPIIVGGTGLYVQALTEGFQLKLNQNANLKNQNDNSKRKMLEQLSAQELQKILKKIDPESFEKIDIKNPHRLIRAIERAQEGNIPTKRKPNFEVLQIGINWPREQLYSRIDMRVEERFKQGMLEEIEGLLKEGVCSEWLIGLGLEYREITNYIIQTSKFKPQNDNLELKNIEQEISYGKMKDQLKLRIRQFSRRQMTWFKRFPEIVWENDYSNISKIVKDFLK
jgi:tRNA dimethylallyltransferase